MALHLFNTLSGTKEEFIPLQPGKVFIYVCGPTVYDRSHIGHGRAYVVYDAIVRYLRFRGYDVTYARNITDIDDKIIKRANAEGVTFEEVARKYTEYFNRDLRALGLLDPNHAPRATETISEMLEMIATLISKGKAYAAHGDVYFAIASDPDYGKLSKKDIKDLRAGARVEPGEQKKDPLDFALWKAAKPSEPSWDSPWGPGRPGWHIECSAMSKKLLGTTIDIHAGGRDLIFPHHENEIAQSEAANGQIFARYWLHNGFVNIDKEKMSKSLGNIVALEDLLKRFHSQALRLYLLSSHYRSPMDFSDVALEEAARGMDRMYRVLLSVPKNDQKVSTRSDEARFIEAMDDDFNTAKAIGVLFEMAAEANRLQKKAETLAEASAIRGEMVRLANILGLLTSTAEDYFQNQPQVKSLDRSKIERLIADRAVARRMKDFARADQIRDELHALKIEVEDSADGTSWRIRG